MSKKYLLILLMVIQLAYQSYAIAGQDGGIDLKISMLKQSNGWQDRWDAVRELEPLWQTNKRVQNALIDEFIFEYDRVRSGRFEKCETCDEGTGELGYYNYLIDLTTPMRSDKLYNIYKEIGYVRALIYFGDRGISEVVAIINSADCAQLISILTSLTDVLAKGEVEGAYVPDSTEKYQIKHALINKLKVDKPPVEHDVYYEVRMRECIISRSKSVVLLGWFAERDDTAAYQMLMELNKNDPFGVMIYDRTQKKKVLNYPVRMEAQKVLDRIKSAKPEKPAITNQPAQ